MSTPDDTMSLYARKCKAPPEPENDVLVGREETRMLVSDYGDPWVSRIVCGMSIKEDNSVLAVDPRDEQDYLDGKEHFSVFTWTHSRAIPQGKLKKFYTTEEL